MSSLNELRTAWCVLGIVAVASVIRISGALPFALLPWAVGLGLLVRPSARGVQAGLRELLGKTPGRMAVLAVIAVVLLVAVLTNAGIALVLFCWIAAASLVTAAIAGPARFAELFVNASLSLLVLAGLAGMLEAGLRLPVLARRLGTPQERARWERAYDHVELRNGFHLRSRHATIPRRPGVRRILAMGDSFTWGDKILSTDSLWPTLLEEDLSRASPELPTEIVNLSQRGWNTVQEVAALNRLGWQFSPDRIILQFYANDAELTRDEMQGATARVRKAARSQAGDLMERSALLWVLKRLATGHFNAEARNRDFLRAFSDEAPGWRRMREALHEMADSAKARAVPVTLVLFPDLAGGSWTPATYPLAPVHHKVADEARVNGFDVLDLTPIYAAEGGDWSRWWATAYDGHPNPAAHLVAVRAIAEHLGMLGWPGAIGQTTSPAEHVTTAP